MFDAELSPRYLLFAGRVCEEGGGRAEGGQGEGKGKNMGKVSGREGEDKEEGEAASVSDGLAGATWRTDTPAGH